MTDPRAFYNSDIEISFQINLNFSKLYIFLLFE